MTKNQSFNYLQLSINIRCLCCRAEDVLFLISSFVVKWRKQQFHFIINSAVESEAHNWEGKSSNSLATPPPSPDKDEQHKQRQQHENGQTPSPYNFSILFFSNILNTYISHQNLFTFFFIFL